MEIAGNSNAETSTAFLQQLRENHPGPLVVIWDNGPAHRGEAIRSYLATPDLHLRLVALPAYSPDFNADEAVWDWAREEVTANECLGTKAQVQEKMNAFFDGLTHRKDEVRHRCRTLLQARADALMFTPAVPLPSLQNVVPWCLPWLWFRLLKERDKYWLTIPYPAQCDIETPRGDGVVALDPGVRSFLTFFSEADCGKVGYQAFGRIQRLCQPLDRLISRTDQEKNRKKRRNMRKAQARMRQKIINLVDELHWQCARWLTSNYRVILLPKFETQSMTRRGERQIQSKTARKTARETARMMLSFQHYRFKKRLQWKAWQRGSLVLEVNEAYTSRTRSWDGRVDEKLGGSRTIRDESGFIMDRDINGARGIFLRALGDSPFLRELLTRVASQQTSTLLNIC